jgi:hypothetical protein
LNLESPLRGVSRKPRHSAQPSEAGNLTEIQHPSEVAFVAKPLRLPAALHLAQAGASLQAAVIYHFLLNLIHMTLPDGSGQALHLESCILHLAS